MAVFVAHAVTAMNRCATQNALVVALLHQLQVFRVYPLVGAAPQHLGRAATGDLAQLGRNQSVGTIGGVYSHHVGQVGQDLRQIAGQGR